MPGKFGILNPFRKWKKGDLPCDPFVYISLNSHGEKDGHIILTGSLAHEDEIDHAIDKLKADLELARKEAKKKLLNQREKIKMVHTDE
jgi:LPS O-antigen subunit length determinant protein (WzzB/FepE family)